MQPTASVMTLLVLLQVPYLSEQGIDRAKPALVYLFDQNSNDTEYKKVFDQVAQNASNCYYVNCSDTPGVCKSLQPQRLPSIQFLKGSVIFTYSGKAEYEQMAEFNEVLSKPLLIDVPSEAAFLQNLEHYDVKVGFLATGPERDIFEEALTFLQGRVPVGYYESNATALVAFRDQKRYEIETSDASELAKFARMNEHQHFQKLQANEAVVEELLSERYELIGLFCLNLSEKADKLIGKHFREFLYQQTQEETDVAEMYRFAYADVKEHEKLCEIGGAAPSLFVVDQRVPPIITYKYEIKDIEALEKYVADILNGEVKGEKLVDPSQKSANILVDSYLSASKIGIYVIMVFVAVTGAEYVKKLKGEYEARKEPIEEETENVETIENQNPAESFEQVVLDEGDRQDVKEAKKDEEEPDGQGQQNKENKKED